MHLLIPLSDSFLLILITMAASYTREHVIIFLKIHLLMFLVALGFHRCAWPCSRCEWEQLSSCGVGSSRRSGFSCGTWALGTWASVVVAHGLSCPAAHGISLDQ